MMPRACVKTLGAAVAALWLGACAQQPANLYTWGSYEQQLNARFKSTSGPEQQIGALEQTLQTAQGRRLPPGFHAHLGMLYGEVGRVDEMRQQFETEKALYPEAAPFMDFLLRKFKNPGAKS